MYTHKGGGESEEKEEGRKQGGVSKGGEKKQRASEREYRARAECMNSVCVREREPCDSAIEKTEKERGDIITTIINTYCFLARNREALRWRMEGMTE